MITTARVARFLRALPHDDAAAILDTLAQVTADPAVPSPRCTRLAANLWEARLTLHHRRQFRVMFGYRAGVPVVLSALEKRDSKRHQLEIDHARAALSSDDIPQGDAMPYKLPTDAPFDLRGPWLYSSAGEQVRIVHHMRRKVVIATAAGRVTLNRAALERVGQDVVNGVTYRVNHPTYSLPEPLENIA